MNDVLIEWNSVEQFRQHQRIIDLAGRDFDRTNLQRFFVDPYVHLAPNPAFGTPMLSGIPFAFTLRFDAGTVVEEVQYASFSAIRQAQVQRSLTAAQDAEVTGTYQSNPASRSKLCTKPVVCLVASRTAP